MYRVPFWLVLVPVLLFSTANSEEQDVKMALVEFMGKLSPGNVQRDANWGWNATSDPCRGKWEGITRDSSLNFVKKIVLNGFNLTGVLDANSLKTSTLFVLSLQKNNIVGGLAEEISGCKNLTHLYLRGKHFSGTIPSSVSRLNNLKRFDVSYNKFSGELPVMSKVSGLLTFLAENNQFSGEIPTYDFSNLEQLNVSHNSLSGPIPDVDGRFNESSFSGNPGLCGKPLSNVCPPPPGRKSKNSSGQYLIYSGYAILGLIVVLIVGYNVIKKIKSKDDKTNATDKAGDDSDSSSEFKNGGNRSEFSLTSAESGKASASLVVLSTPEVNGLKFEDLLRAPAEMLGRGKHGSLYKVTPDRGLTLVVKKDQGLEDF